MRRCERIADGKSRPSRSFYRSMTHFEPGTEARRELHNMMTTVRPSGNSLSRNGIGWARQEVAEGCRSSRAGSWGKGRDAILNLRERAGRTVMLEDR